MFKETKAYNYKDIDETYENINNIKLDINLKIDLKDHQKMLLFNIINYISNNGKYRCEIEENEYITGNNNNIWIKLEIGAGKTLPVLSLIEYYKYHDIQSNRIPVGCDFITRTKYNKTLLKSYNIVSNPSNWEIIKDSGFTIDNSLTNNYINLENGDCNILFVQSQVFEQFEKYIKEQTYLTYISLSNINDIIEFMIKPDYTKDILLIDSDNISNIIFSICARYKQIFADYIYENKIKEAKIQLKEKFNINNIKITETEINNYISTARSNFNITEYSTLDKTEYFNKFIFDLQKNYNKAFKFIIFDDYDLMNLDFFYPPYCLYKIYISGTRIKSYILPNYNCISTFINDEFINYNSSITINEKLINKIINIPDHITNNIPCRPIISSIIDSHLILYIYRFINIFKSNLPIIENLYDKDMFLNLSINDIMIYSLENNSDYTKIYMDTFIKFISPDIIDKSDSIMRYFYLIRFIIYYLDLYIKFSNKEFKDLPKEKINEKLKRLNFAYDYLNSEILMSEINTYNLGYFYKFVLKILPMIKSNLQYIDKDKLFDIKDKIVNYLSEFKFNIIKLLSDIKFNSYIIKESFDKEKKPETYILTCCNNIITHNEICKTYYRNFNSLYCKFCGKEVIDKIKYIPLGDFTDEYVDNMMEELDENLYDDKPENYVNIVYDKIGKVVEIINKNMNKETNKLDKKIMIYITNLFEEDKIKKLLAERYKSLNVSKFDYKNNNNTDILIINNLKSIIGINMIWIDDIIIYNIPDNNEELKQIIGRTHRFGRIEETHSYNLFYPSIY